MDFSLVDGRCEERLDVSVDVNAHMTFSFSFLALYGVYLESVVYEFGDLIAYPRYEGALVQYVGFG